ncbi:MAG: hypothetical protein HQ521_01660 [Bacteroidetes bacterium]|nr:hypothetical protein [Bacteroidota bacterium]
MKRLLIIISLAISILIMGSCREIKVNTIVNKDGSFTRIITITGDSSDVFKSGLPFPIDSTWAMKFEKDSTGNKNDVLTYTKYFNNSDGLNQEITQDSSWRKNLKRYIEIERKFGFFYSYLVYKETIGAANPFTILNYKDFISKEDLQWLTGKRLALVSSDSAAIKLAEDTASAFLQESITAEIIDILKNGIEQLNNPAININLVEKYKDSIAKKVDEWNYNSTNEFVDYYAKLTNNKDILKIKETNRAQLENLDSDMELLLKILEMEDYKVTVELPGLITNTNSLSINGNKVEWSVNNMSFLFEDYSLIAESRIINIWMFIITGIVILALVVTTIFKSGKR